MKRLKTYKVQYSNHASAKVRAFSAKGAREQAWKMLGGYKYGWNKSEFIEKSRVAEL